MLRYAKGDVTAFDLLYNKHKAAVYRFFVRQPLTREVAEELCHDVWLKIINQRDNYQDTALFTTYLFTIARRIAMDHTQNKRVRFDKQCVEKDIENVIGEDNDSISNGNATLAIALKKQIAALPYDQREVFLLKQEAGFTLDDIATITSQNKEKVKSCWRYALQKIRKGLRVYEN